jgi:hypothetical protein
VLHYVHLTEGDKHDRRPGCVDEISLAGKDAEAPGLQTNCVSGQGPAWRD